MLLREPAYFGGGALLEQAASSNATCETDCTLYALPIAALKMVEQKFTIFRARIEAEPNQAPTLMGLEAILADQESAPAAGVAATGRNWLFAGMSGTKQTESGGGGGGGSNVNTEKLNCRSSIARGGRGCPCPRPD